MITRCYLEITNVCNLDCVFCPKTERKKQVMSLDEFHALTDKLAGKVKFLYFHLMGEPFLHPLLPEFIHLARKKGFIPVLTTNGTLLSKREEMLEALPHKIQISLHSHEGNQKENLSQYIHEVVTFAVEAASYLIRLSKEKDILNIWGAGNDGRISPSAAAVAASYDEELRAWLVVGALNADGIEVKEAGGKRELIIKSGMCNGDKGSYDCNASPTFSNAFKGAALYAITAPGVDIDSANAYYGKTQGELPGKDQRPMCSGGEQEEFCGMSGTSQATPMVSGAAMLVQQKFGFLGGAQLADVLLTTANNDFKAPKLMLKYLGKGSLANIIYVGDEIPTTTDGKIDEAQVRKDLESIGYKKDRIDEIFKNLLRVNGSPEGIIKLSKEEVFGQGILDVQKALKGLARLDVNRMNKNSVENFEGENQAFYTIDTKGLSGEFSNNIDQRLWEDKWHIDGAWNSPKEELKDIKKSRAYQSRSWEANLKWDKYLSRCYTRFARRARAK